jgi:hypothetical protein
MPFVSKAQKGWMYANEPEIAARWEDKYGIPKNLPAHVKKKKPDKNAWNKYRKKKKK